MIITNNYLLREQIIIFNSLSQCFSLQINFVVVNSVLSKWSFLLLFCIHIPNGFITNSVHNPWEWFLLQYLTHWHCEWTSLEESCMDITFPSSIIHMSIQHVAEKNQIYCAFHMTIILWWKLLLMLGHESIKVLW